jgi:hypothetical protein
LIFLYFLLIDGIKSRKIFPFSTPLRLIWSAGSLAPIFLPPVIKIHFALKLLTEGAAGSRELEGLKETIINIIILLRFGNGEEKNLGF